MFVLDRSKNDTSIVLDGLRAGAAQMVCLGHGNAFFLGHQTFHPQLQNLGVQIFFVLSGLLISYTLVESSSRDPSYGFASYFVERFARIYSGLVPALVLVAVVDWIAGYGQSDFQTLLANLAMLEQYRGAFDNCDCLQWQVFGSASPLWTLAIEWHIYLFVGAIYFIGRTPRWAPLLILIAVIFGQLPSHYIFGDLQRDGVGYGLFLLWLGGAYIFLALRAWRPSIPLCVGILALAAYEWFDAATRTEYNATSYFWLVVGMFAIVAASQRSKMLRLPALNRLTSFFAGYSFTLYLIHHTIMAAAVSFGFRGWLAFAGTVLVSNVVAAATAIPTEMKHRQLARWLKKRLRSPSGVDRAELLPHPGRAAGGTD